MSPWMVVLLFAGGFVLLVVGAELLVRGASRLAIAVGITPLVVGQTIVAYGTSAPELAVTINGALHQQADVSVGNVVGSNIANILLVLGLAALLRPISVSRPLLQLALPLMVVASVLVPILGWDGTINRLEGLGLVIGSFGYTWICVRQSKQARATAEVLDVIAEMGPISTRSASEAPGPSIPDGDIGQAGTSPARVDGVSAATTGASSTVDEPRQGSSLGTGIVNLVLVVVGIAMLIGGADLLLRAATQVARSLGVSELVIGLTIVAVGTSLPEIATSILAGMRGESDIAMGNAVGSNLFNILLVLGAAAVISPGGVPVADNALRFDIPFMVCVALACVPIFYRGMVVSRWEGALLLSFYVAYLGYLVLDSAGHAAFPAYRHALIGYAGPAALASLVVLAGLDALRRRSRVTSA